MLNLESILVAFVGLKFGSVLWNPVTMPKSQNPLRYHFSLRKVMPEIHYFKSTCHILFVLSYAHVYKGKRVEQFDIYFE